MSWKRGEHGQSWRDVRQIGAATKPRNGYAGAYECLFRKGRNDIGALLEIAWDDDPGVHSSMVGFAAKAIGPAARSERGEISFPTRLSMHGATSRYGKDRHPPRAIPTAISRMESTRALQAMLGTRPSRHHSFERRLPLRGPTRSPREKTSSPGQSELELSSRDLCGGRR